MALFNDNTFAVYAPDGVTPVPNLASSATWLYGGPFNAATGLPVVHPTISDCGGGVYSVGHYASNVHVVGWVDFGPSAGMASRWQFYESGADGRAAFGLHSAVDGSPLPGMAGSQSWSWCVDIVAKVSVVPPVVYELVAGTGIYIAPDITVPGQHIAGICTFGGAYPTYEYDSAGAGAVLPVTDAQATSAPQMLPLAVPLTQQDFLDMFDRLFPVEYLGPMKAKAGDGYEFFQALAKVGARLSTAVVNLEAAGCLLVAQPAGVATVTVNICRDAPSVGGITVTVKAGTQLKCSGNGQRFVLAQDVVLAPTSTGAFPASANAVAPGYEYNVKGAITTPRGDLLAGEIDTITRLVEDPPFGDTTIYVTQPSDATGGVPGALEQQGADRGLTIQPGETAAQYRYRVRQLVDTVSPGAITRAVTQYCAPKKCAFQVMETFDEHYFGCWDAPSVATPVNPNWLETAFAYDEDLAHRPYWLDARDSAAAFVVLVAQIASIFEMGGAWDDPAVNTSDWTNPLGLRTVLAWDETAAICSAYDGSDYQGNAFYAGLWDLLQQIRAGGVAASLELQGQ